MHRYGVAMRCQRQSNRLSLTFLGNKLFSDKAAHTTLITKRRSKKLNSVLNANDSHTRLTKEPVKLSQKSGMRDFINKASTKFSEIDKKVQDVKLYIPGSGAIGATKCLFLRSGGTGYLFNCGEGIQKISHQGFMLPKVRNIFISNLVWGNVGGLPGMFKLVHNINESSRSNHDINIYGPPGLKQLHEVWRSLMYLRGQKIEFIDTTKDKLFDDGILKIESVPLYPLSETFNADDAVFTGDKEYDKKEANLKIDAIIEHFLSYDYYGFPLKSQIKQKLKMDDITLLMTDVYRKRKASICYICKIRGGSDTLSLEACVDHDVPASLLGKLKAGEDVTLLNGNVVRFADVSVSGATPITFAVVDCPGEGYIDSLLEEPSFKELQSATVSEGTPILVVHFSPPSVMNHPKYVEWMKIFPVATKQLRINEENICIGNVVNHELQTKLNLLHEEIFPKLQNPAIPVVSMSNHFRDFEKFDISTKNDSFYFYKIEKKLRQRERQTKWEPLANFENNILEGRSKMVIDLKKQSVGSDVSFVLCPEQYVQEALIEEGAVEALKNLKKELREIEPTIDSKTKEDYPKFLFLGTGSGCPRDLRNSSGILVFTNENTCMLLDCGEGTYNRINVLFGREKTDEVLLKLKAVYISHMHSDHHFGLIEVLKGRRRAINNLLSKKNCKELPEYRNLSKAQVVSKLNIKPLYLLAPHKMLDWLSFYDMFYEKLKSDFTFISNGTFDVMSDWRMLGSGDYTKMEKVKKSLSPEMIASFLQDVGLNEFRTCIVDHCFGAFGLAFKTNDYKISYSGDCMPSRHFINIGSDSDLLIHEATYENDLATLAEKKKHSTVAQALFAAKSTKAKFTLLTHFSQRYKYIPLNTETFPDNIGISFDFMMVSMKQLQLLPKFLPVMRIIFGDSLKKSTDKTLRRKLQASQGLQ